MWFDDARDRDEYRRTKGLGSNKEQTRREKEFSKHGWAASEDIEEYEGTGSCPGCGPYDD